MGIMAPTTSSGGVAYYVKSTVPGSRLLQIDGYSIAKQATNGTSFRSCPFTVGGYSWAIHLFPNGDRPDSAGFISVFLALDEYVDGPIKLQLEFSFIDDVDKQDPTHVRTRQAVDLLSYYAVGYRRFIAREAMESSRHLKLKDDRFTIRCDFVVMNHGVIPENLHASGHRKCVACNLRVATAGWLPLLHSCFCDVSNDACRNGTAAKQCAGCHVPYEGILMSPGPFS